MNILYIKALHIIFVVTWFAGLFYIVRLFIYNTEANDLPEPKKSILQTQFKIMQKRLWYGITWPSMVLTLCMGALLVYNMPVLLKQSYFLLKLIFVLALIIYHLKCHQIFKNLQNDIIKNSQTWLRIWNEVATVLLVAIVFLIVLKSNTGLVKGLLGLVAFTSILMFAIKVYKKYRENKNNLKG
jgi:putative membrane protein